MLCSLTSLGWSESSGAVDGPYCLRSSVPVLATVYKLLQPAVLAHDALRCLCSVMTLAV